MKQQNKVKSEMLVVRMTATEKKMLRTLAARSTASTDSGWVRSMIRDAWVRREAKKLAARERKSSTR